MGQGKKKEQKLLYHFRSQRWIVQAVVMGRAGAAPGATGAVGHLGAASPPSSTSLQPHPRPLHAPQLPGASSELLQFPLWAPQGFHCQGDLMQIRLAGPALITALLSMGGSRECTSSSSGAWENHGQVPQGQKPPPGSVPTGKESLCSSHQVRSSLPARDAGSGSAQDELHTHPKIAPWWCTASLPDCGAHQHLGGWKRRPRQ